MRFLADMGISVSTVNWLRSRGYDAIHARETGMQRSSDVEIIKRAQSENRIVITVEESRYRIRHLPIK